MVEGFIGAAGHHRRPTPSSSHRTTAAQPTTCLPGAVTSGLVPIRNLVYIMLLILGRMYMCIPTSFESPSTNTRPGMDRLRRNTLRT